MAFYENNIQRIRNDLKHLLTDDDFTNFMPCSKKSMCTIKDMISSDVELENVKEEADNVAANLEEVAVEEVAVKEEADNVAANLEEVAVEEVAVEETEAENLIDEIEKSDMEAEKLVSDVEDVEDEDSDIENLDKLKITLPPMDDTDESSNSDDSDMENSKEMDDDSDYETELDIIRDNETKLKKLKTNYFSNETVPISYEDDDEFVNNLIKRELEGKTYVNYNDKSYKVEINSAEPESDKEEEELRVEKKCKKYNNFEAFYEDYIANNKEFEQLKVFNKIIAHNLVQHPFLIDIMNQFREDIINVWMAKFKQAQKSYQFVNFDSKKWIKRAENFIFTSKLKKPIIEYLHSIGALIVLFDINLTFNLNKHLYKNIEFESIKPLNLKKEIYNANELVQYHNYGKNISKILIQDVVDNISVNQNINIMNLDIDLFNRVFKGKLNKLDECIEPDLQKKVNQYILKDNNFPDLLKQPIIYIDPDSHQVYMFEYHKLCKNFDEKNYINPFTDKPFEQEFIEQCLEKMKNINLCNYCKDNCSKQTLKTIYQDPNFGPIVLKFCSVDCFSDIEWKPKVLLNTII